MRFAPVLIIFAVLVRQVWCSGPWFVVFSVWYFSSPILARTCIRGLFVALNLRFYEMSKPKTRDSQAHLKPKGWHSHRESAHLKPRDTRMMSVEHVVRISSQSGHSSEELTALTHLWADLAARHRPSSGSARRYITARRQPPHDRACLSCCAGKIRARLDTCEQRLEAVVHVK